MKEWIRVHTHQLVMRPEGHEMDSRDKTAGSIFRAAHLLVRLRNIHIEYLQIHLNIHLHIQPLEFIQRTTH